jgi:hypothetical protein
MSISDQIQQRIESFVSELEALVRQAALEAVQQALGGAGSAARVTVKAAPAKVSAAPAPKAAAAPAAKRGSRKKGEKRAPAEIAALTAKLGAYVKAHPGQGIEAIAKGMGRPTSELTLSINKLLATKSIKKTGEKRATKYFPN